MRRWMPEAIFALVLAGTTAANLRVNGQLISTEETDPPLGVVSSAKVDNLNADLLDGLDAADLVTVNDLESSSTLYRQVTFLEDGEFEVPSDVTLVEVMLVGGGGGGGGGAELIGGGGGGSGYVVTYTLGVTPGDTLTIDIGAGGGGASIGEAGQPGEDSVVALSGPQNRRIVAKGGNGGGGPSEAGSGGAGFWGGGGAQMDSGSTSGGAGILGDGEPGTGSSAGEGASGGDGISFPDAGGGGGGGGPGGGIGGVFLPPNLTLPGGAGAQAGAGGGGGGYGGGGGDGAAGMAVLRWFGPAAAST